VEFLVLFNEPVDFGTLPSPALLRAMEYPMEAIYLKDSGDSVMKFAREVHFQIKSGKETEFNNLFEKEVLPILRKQNGFQEEVTLVNPKGAVAISLWDNRQHAETYGTAAYPQVLAKLTPVIAGTPTVEIYETASTYLPV
jgi:quinol monooxygenase YgiN